MIIDGYELNLSEAQLDNILTRQTRKIELISPDFPTFQALSENDKKAMLHLVEAARLIDRIALSQDHPLNLKLQKALQEAAKTSSHAQKALELFESFHGVAGYNGIDLAPIEIFKNVHLLSGKNFYPSDLSVEEFHKILHLMFQRGKIDEIRQILSARTMVRRQNDELVAIDYTEYFKDDFSKIANELEVAAHYTTDEAFKDYLGWQAQALLQNNEEMDILADKHWAVLQDCPFELTISRENYEDEMSGTVFDDPELARLIEEHHIKVVAKDTLGCRVGLVNAKETAYILKSKETLPHLAKWMPFQTQYIQNGTRKDSVKQSMVDVDLMALTGDYAMCRGGITTAQNLPNNDKPSIQAGGGRRNVYHRQIRFAKDAERLQKLLDKLIDPQLHQYVSAEETLRFVIGHENGHSLGPDSSYQNALGLYKHIIEEHKADTVSVASMPELKRTFDQYKDIDLRCFYTSWVVHDLMLRARPVLSKPHRVAELIQFNYLIDQKVLSFDENKKLHINFDLIEAALYRLLEDTIRIQLSRSSTQARDFIDRWGSWGEWPEYIASVQRELGLKPYIQLVTHF
jgi:hypothetical protein